ncbi:MAG: hypothetical protein GTO18_12330 [Anaerolineales bacterium]|nr:hypothetical protein [Anaerolineales bacterium]
MKSSHILILFLILVVLSVPIAVALSANNSSRVSGELPTSTAALEPILLPTARPTGFDAALENAERLQLDAAGEGPFPRLSAFTWGGGVPDFYAKFDLLDWSNNDVNAAKSIKTLNPYTRIVVTRDINSGLGLNNDEYPDSWKTRTSTGEFCKVYSGMSHYADYTNFAPRLPEYGNKRYNEYVATYMVELVDLTVFDGVATDGLWENYWGGAPCDTDIDLDRNGINDYEEYGRGWVSERIREGAETTVANLRTAIGKDKLLIVNSGGPHIWGRSVTNGFIHEHFTGLYGFEWFKNRYDTFILESARPSMPIVNADTISGSPIVPEKNDFQHMRFSLTFALITGAYFDFTDYDRAGEHYWVRYYDEFDVNLGYPTGPARKTSSGAWVRFFDNGMVIINGSDTETITVTVDDVNLFLGYAPGFQGTYWRIQGGQDLSVNGVNAMNNGAPFDGQHPIHLSLRRSDPTLSDGVILLREPQSVVSDIVIDNADSGTSPGSSSPGDNSSIAMPGFSQAKDCEQGSQYYTVRCAIYTDPNSSPPDTTYLSPPFAIATGGSSSNAIYTPNIGIAGNYEVFEWHGSLSDGSPATNVTFTINHANGTSSLAVDQSTKVGQWNSLGTYTFNQGTAGNVTIAALGADGTVIADAIKWVYRDNNGEPTFADVPLDHWAYDYIEVLYQSGYVAGCNSDPLMYCPENSMTRAESAVFVERGIHDANYTPPQPVDQVFNDVAHWEWFAKWTNALWQDSYTSGCATDPLRYCPLQQHIIAEGAVFYLRMLHGADYVPPQAQGIFNDVPINEWYAPWVEAAYTEGLIIPCQVDPDLKACPLDPLTRALGAYMMVQAKGLLRE